MIQHEHEQRLKLEEMVEHLAKNVVSLEKKARMSISGLQVRDTGKFHISLTPPSPPPFCYLSRSLSCYCHVHTLFIVMFPLFIVIFPDLLLLCSLSCYCYVLCLVLSLIMFPLSYYVLSLVIMSLSYCYVLSFIVIFPVLLLCSLSFYCLCSLTCYCYEVRFLKTVFL